MRFWAKRFGRYLTSKAQLKVFGAASWYDCGCPDSRRIEEIEEPDDGILRLLVYLVTD